MLPGSVERGGREEIIAENPVNRLNADEKIKMPERDGAGDDDPVFPTLPCEDTCNVQLKPWVRAAGITKHVTYHMSRHTFATMLLTLGQTFIPCANCSAIRM